eukprot:TRINITY_DN3264_c0_g1_i3.p1 TRINITY_DN3264_c0_g1~~TRINITY_DN3264_c0_g1_i3.p1  ORF type:complete len:631 (+),score=146.21 TRINITY_DN3264_c0_g1_i3:807-2699(+)
MPYRDSLFRYADIDEITDEGVLLKNIFNDEPPTSDCLFPDGVVIDLFNNALKNSPDAPYLGIRLKENGSFKEEFSYLTYQEVDQLIYQLGAFFIAEGLKFGDRIVVWSQNSLAFSLIQLACHRYGFPMVGLYDSINKAQRQFILQDSKPSLIFVAQDKIHHLSDDRKMLQNEFVFPMVFEIPVWQSKLIDDHPFYSLFIGIKDFVEPPILTPDDTCDIIYTSGTSGNPKGAILFNQALVNMIETCHSRAMSAEIGFLRAVHFMPYAHIFGRVALYYPTKQSGQIAIFTSLNEFSKDLTICQPTIFFTVPRVLTKIREKALGMLEEKNWFVRGLVKAAYGLKKFRVYTLNRWLGGALNSLGGITNVFFKAFKNALGGEVKVIVTAGAMLPEEDCYFFRLFASTYTQNVYGATETTGAVLGCKMEDIPTGQVGGPGDLNNIMIANHIITDEYIEGEAYFRGPAVLRQYYNGPPIQDENGWYHTGDVVRYYLSNGTCEIMGRCGDTIKLPQGEFVALQELSTTFAKIPGVINCQIIGKPTRSHVIGVIEVDKNVFDVYDSNLEHNLIEIFKNYAHECEIPSFATPKRLIIELDENIWTIENGFLTPTQKQSRKGIEKYYEKEIEDLFVQIDAI